MNPDRAWAGLRLADDAVTVRELLSHPGGVDSYAVLGQLIADLTGTSFAQAATRLVLEPLGMADSWFPAQAPVSPTPFDRLITARAVPPARPTVCSGSNVIAAC